MINPSVFVRTSINRAVGVICGDGSDDFADCFTADNWTQSGTEVAINTIDEDVDWDIVDGGDGEVIDMLGAAISDTAWVLRYRLETVTFTGTRNEQMVEDLSDDTDTGENASSDYLGFRTVKSTIDEYGLYFGDNAKKNAGSSQIFARAWQAETVFIEMIRLSATSYSVELFSDEYITPLETQTVTIASTIDALRHAHIETMKFGGGAAECDGTVDTWLFKDGVTSY